MITRSSCSRPPKQLKTSSPETSPVFAKVLLSNGTENNVEARKDLNGTSLLARDLTYSNTTRSPETPISLLLQLPTEILFTIENAMTADQVICLGLTCKTLWRTLSIARHLRSLRFDRRWNGNMSRFMAALEPDLPDLWPCHVCLKFHYRDSLEVVGSEAEIKNHFLQNYPWSQRKLMTQSEKCLRRCRYMHTSCESLSGYILLQHNRPVWWESCRLVMRTETMSPQHGIPLNRLEYHWSDSDSNKEKKLRIIRPRPQTNFDDVFIPKQIDILPRISEGHLILRIDHVVPVYPNSFKDVEDPGRDLFICCSHLSLNEGDALNSFFLQAVEASRRPNRPPDAIKPHRCSWCATEFTIESRLFSTINEHADNEKCSSLSPGSHSSFLLCLTVWRDLGKMKHPEDRLWQNQCQERTQTRNLNWQLLSFGNRSLKDVYEGRPGERIDFEYAALMNGVGQISPPNDEKF